jgi:hypothetical protein
MKAQGQITIEEGLILNNPTMEINNISYLQLTNRVLVECIFNEENSTFPHSRNFSFDTKGNQLTKPDILKLISEHDILKTFK